MKGEKVSEQKILAGTVLSFDESTMQAKIEVKNRITVGSKITIISKKLKVEWSQRLISMSKNGIQITIANTNEIVHIKMEKKTARNDELFVIIYEFPDPPTIPPPNGYGNIGESNPVVHVEGDSIHHDSVNSNEIESGRNKKEYENNDEPETDNDFPDSKYFPKGKRKTPKGPGTGG